MPFVFKEIDLYAEQTKLSFSASLLQINVEISLRLSQRERGIVSATPSFTHMIIEIFQLKNLESSNLNDELKRL